MCDASTLYAYWEAIHRFTEAGDVETNLSLLSHLSTSLQSDAARISVVNTMAPLLLQQYVSGTSPVQNAPSALVCVCILNRVLCLRYLPEALAQPLDRRPGDLVGLTRFYQSIVLNPELPMVARRQLVQCVAVLQIVAYDDVPTSVQEVFSAAGTPGWYAFHNFMAVIDILTDSRVPIGPIKRATQRRQLQASLEVVLTATSEDCLELQCEAVGKAIAFLREGVMEEAQDVAEVFWDKLPMSPVWQYAVNNIQSGQYTSVVVDMVCEALRCLTILDGNAEALLQSVVPIAMQNNAAVNQGASCRIVSSAMESTTEEVIMMQEPEGQLFALISGAAEFLAVTLESATVTDEAIQYVCEGVSVLTQVLQPAPLPEMDPTDDPEDFACVIESANQSNQDKAATLQILQGFLSRCQGTLLQRLVGPLTVDDLADIASYATQWAKSQEVDYEVYHADTALALFTTYERLCRLLKTLPAEATTLAQRGCVPAVMCDAAASSSLLLHGDMAGLLHYAVLLPALTARYAKPVEEGGDWSADALHALLGRMAQLLERAGGAERNVVAAAHVAACVVAFVQCGGSSALNVGNLGQTLWRCLLLPGDHASRWGLADSVACLLDLSCVPTPSPEVISLILKLDARTQVSVLSACQMDNFQSFVYLLRAMQQLSPSEDEVVLQATAARVRRVAGGMISNGVWDAAAYEEAICSFFQANIQFIAVFLEIAGCLPHDRRATVRAVAVLQYFSSALGKNTSSADLDVAIFSDEVCGDVSIVVRQLNPAYYGPQYGDLLRWLLQPDPSFSIASGWQRLRAVARCARSLYEAAPASAEQASQFALSFLPLAVERLKNVRASDAISQGETSSKDGGAENDNAIDMDEMLEEVYMNLSIVSRYVQGCNMLPADAPEWMSALQRAVDDYERRSILKKAGL